ncbi:MAG: hypothetical protein ACOYEV_01935 [Candidatus Nanopelagicales bacterium]
MPRIQVYLPADLYAAVKERGLPASELLQEAVRAELHRLGLEERADSYLDELLTEVGPPTPADLAYAQALTARIAAHAQGVQRAG